MPVKLRQVSSAEVHKRSYARGGCCRPVRCIGCGRKTLNRLLPTTRVRNGVVRRGKPVCQSCIDDRMLTFFEDRDLRIDRWDVILGICDSGIRLNRVGQSRRARRPSPLDLRSCKL